MFDGNDSCALCQRALSKSERNYGMCLSGWTYAFCDKCFKERKDDVRKLLHARR